MSTKSTTLKITRSIKKILYTHINTLLIVLLSVYGIWVWGIHQEVKHLYSWRFNQPICKPLTIAVQPVMDILLHEKITHACNWRNTSWKPDTQFIILQKGQEQSRILDSYNPYDILKTIYIEFTDPTTEVLEPINYDGEWYIVFFDPKSGLAQESTLTVRGPVKVLVDGEGHFQGRTVDDDIIELQTVVEPKDRIPYL